MLTRINNDADEFATLQAIDLEPPCSYPKLISTLTKLCPEDEDLEIIIHKALLPSSYRGNPTMLAKNTHAKLDPDSFQSFGGYTLSNTHIGIRIMRAVKTGRHNVIPEDMQSVPQQILKWLERVPETELDIPMSNVPDYIKHRPEQLVYNIKRQTDKKIQIKKFKNFIRISLK